MTPGEIIVHDSERVILPGDSCTIIARPQIGPVRPRALVVHAFARFELTDCCIGNRSQFICAGYSVDLAPFVLPSERTRPRELSTVAVLSFETIQAAMGFWITIRNVGDKPSRFIAEWICDTSPRPEQAEPTRARRLIPGEAYDVDGEEITPASEIASASGMHRVPGRSGRPGLETRPPPGWGWNPGDLDGEG